MKPVFISYSRADNTFVERLHTDLLARGINVWLDQVGLKAGTRNWEQALRDALRQAGAVLLIASPHSRQSNYVQGELDIAEMYRCPIYPVWAAGEHWPDCVPIGCTKMQYIDARGAAYDTAITQLVDVLGQTAPVIERAERAPEYVEPDFEPRNPYKGLQAFEERDSGDFFGRERLVEELVETLGTRLDEPRVLVVVGPSGSGKSSLVMAGLIPRLRAGALPGSAAWVYLDRTVPGAHPLENLSVTLSHVLPEKALTTIRQDLDDPDGRGLHLLGRQIARGTDQRALLFIDQFEELFTQTIQPDERQQLITLLTTAILEPHGPIIALLTLRADFYDRPMAYERLGQLIEKHHKAVLPMSLEDLRAVIEKPAALSDVQLRFDAGLVGDLLFEVREQVGGLPLLQFALLQLFQHRQGHTLRLDAYREMGGLSGALTHHAEATFEALATDDHRRLARSLFLRLIEPSATEQDTTRRRAAMSELVLPDAEQSRTLREVCDAFTRARLLTTSEVAGKAMIEVSHEALIREWKRLSDWLHYAREDVVIQRNVSEDAVAWLARGCGPDDDGLYRGAILLEIRAWAGRNDPSQDEMAFITAAMALEERQAEEDRQRQARELRLAQDAAENAHRAEQAEKARAVRARRAAIMAAILGILALITSVVAVVAMSEARATQSTTERQATMFALSQGDQMRLLNGLGMVPIEMQNPLPATAIAMATRLAQSAPLVIQAFDGVEMVQVPPGCFYMGSAFNSDEQPVNQVCFETPFWIDRYEVTNAQFEQHHGVARNAGYWDGPDRPRTNITWEEARNYCEQRGGASGSQRVRLPTEAEWEYAAKGLSNLLYPWGDDFARENVVSSVVKSQPGGPLDVGSRPAGASWVGAEDMSGNVWEWTSTIYDPERFNYPYDPADGREDAGQPNGPRRVVRGGAWDTRTIAMLRTAYRDGVDPGPTSFVGFRCVQSELLPE